LDTPPLLAFVRLGYGCNTVTGDHYAGEWPRERFRKHGVSYRTADLNKSELYRALLPRLNSGTVELLEHETATKQLLALERRTTSAGREIIDHPPGRKDDVINAIAGAAHEVRARRPAIASIQVDTSWQPAFEVHPVSLTCHVGNTKLRGSDAHDDAVIDAVVVLDPINPHRTQTTVFDRALDSVVVGRIQ
jgi:hypothetical protein